MRRNNLNNVKKFESEILKDKDFLVAKGFTYSIRSNQYCPPRIIDKISKLCKKQIDQQLFNSIIYPGSQQNSSQETSQNLDQYSSSNREINRIIDFNIDEILNEVQKQNGNQVSMQVNENFDQKQEEHTIPQLNSLIQDKQDEEIPELNTNNTEIIPDTIQINSENNFPAGGDSFSDHINFLHDYQFKALNELRQHIEAITTEIHRMVQSNQSNSDIDELRKERRDMWDKIEDIERGVQAANDFYKLTKNSKFFNNNTTNNNDDDLDEVYNSKSFSSNADNSNHSSYEGIDNNYDSCCNDMHHEHNESDIFDENSSDFFDIYPEEKDQIDPELFQIITKINHEIFHHAKFRGCQAAAIEACLDKKDVFLLMPTGGGKSLVYQIAGFLDSKLTVIISPLISLIKDQANSLKELNLSARAMTGESSRTEIKEIFEMIKKNELLYLYITPEKLLSSPNIMDFFYDLNQNGMIARFVIDEAHCVSQWGHDFRPCYTELDIIKNRLENLPILVMTATATAAVKKDIISILKIPNCQIFQMSFNRPNLIYQVLDKGDTYQSYRAILSFIREHHFENKCGLIFCMTIADTESICSFLRNQGLRARYYHAQMKDKNERHKVQQLWMEGKVNIIVATLAFGMGIDKPDVRFVIHHTMPKSIESYYQESGRAGRDGLRSYCVLLFNINDRQRVERLIRCDYSYNENTSPSSTVTKEFVITKRKADARLGIELQLLDAMSNYCLDRTTCRRVMLLNYFSENFNPDDCDPKCDNCLRKENGKISIIKVDLTKNAEEMSDIVNEITKRRADQPPFPTARYVISLYIGTDSTRARLTNDSKLKQFGRGGEMAKKDYLLLQIFPILVENKILKTRIKLVKHGAIQYFATGPNYDDFKKKGFPNIEVEDEVESRFEGMSKEDSELFPILLEKRRTLAENRNINVNSICSIKILKGMAKERPKSLETLLQIPGMTSKKAKDYGNYFMEVIAKFESEVEKNKSKKQKSDQSNNPNVSSSLDTDKTKITAESNNSKKIENITRSLSFLDSEDDDDDDSDLANYSKPAAKLINTNSAEARSSKSNNNNNNSSSNYNGNRYNQFSPSSSSNRPAYISSNQSTMINQYKNQNDFSGPPLKPSSSFTPTSRPNYSPNHQNAANSNHYSHQNDSNHQYQQGRHYYQQRPREYEQHRTNSGDSSHQRQQQQQQQHDSYGYNHPVDSYQYRYQQHGNYSNRTPHQNHNNESKHQNNNQQQQQQKQQGNAKSTTNLENKKSEKALDFISRLKNSLS